MQVVLSFTQDCGSSLSFQFGKHNHCANQSWKEILLDVYDTTASNEQVWYYLIVRDQAGLKWPPVYIRYRSSYQKNKVEECKKPKDYIYYCYSNAKWTSIVSVTFYQNLIGENQTWKFRFCSSSLFFFFIMHNSNTIRRVRILCILNNRSASVDLFSLFWASCELRMASYGLKLYL